MPVTPKDRNKFVGGRLWKEAGLDGARSVMGSLLIPGAENRGEVWGTVYKRDLHKHQKRVKKQRGRFNVLSCGRRWGKTTIGIDLGVETVMDGLPVGWFSPTYKMLVEVWREVKTILRPVIVRESAVERRLELASGGVFEFWSLTDPDAVRGRKYAGVIIDEAAMIWVLRDAWMAAIRPALTDYEGWAWFFSTPRGMNYFYELWMKGQREEDRNEGWRSWQMPTRLNPYIPKGEIEAARRGMPFEIFRQEYLAEFLEGSGLVFRNIDAVSVQTNGTPADHQGHRVIAGVDWGQREDFTAISIWCGTCLAELELDRFNRVGYSIQRDRVQIKCHKWNATEITVEENSIGRPMLESLNEEGLKCDGFKTTMQSKAEIIRNFQMEIERGEIRILDDPAGRAELLAYASNTTKTGIMQFSAPQGFHDDTVIARAIALRNIRFLTTNVLRFF